MRHNVPFFQSTMLYLSGINLSMTIKWIVWHGDCKSDSPTTSPIRRPPNPRFSTPQWYRFRNSIQQNQPPRSGGEIGDLFTRPPRCCSPSSLLFYCFLFSSVFLYLSLSLSISLSLSFSPPWKESMLKQLQKFGSEIVTEFDMVFPETNYWHHRKEFHFDWIWIDWLDMNDKRFWGASMTGHFLGIWTPKYH